MRTPESIAGQGMSPFAYYRIAHEVQLGDAATYIPLVSHEAVAEHLINGGDAFVAQDSVSGPIHRSMETMPDVFKHSRITAYAGVILGVEFEGFRDENVPEDLLEVAVAFDPVAKQCAGNIEARGLILVDSSEVVKDTADAAEIVARNGGFFNGRPALALCTKEAGEHFGLKSIDIMSDIQGATRIIAYNNVGEMDPDGDRQLIAIRTDHEPDALRYAITEGFKGVNMTGGAQLNIPERHGYADFSFEFKGNPDDAEQVVKKLQPAVRAARHLGSLTILDTRDDLSRHGPFDHNALATTNPEFVSVYVGMNDVEGAMAEELTRLSGINIAGFRIADRLEADFTRGLVLDFSYYEIGAALRRLNGNAQVLRRAQPATLEA